MLTFDTSYSYDRISFKILGNILKIVKLPLFLHSKQILIILSNSKDIELYKELLQFPTNNKIQLPLLEDGVYYINIYTNNNEKDSSFWSYLQPRSLSIISKSQRFHFLTSPIININRCLVSKIPTDVITLEKFLKPSEKCQSNNSIITSLANRIIKFKVTPYQKVLAIHDWVASNIYYDLDSLNDKSCNSKLYTAIDVLNSKKCVCRGFTNLGVALMRASGIPAIGISCYSLNVCTDGGWEKEDNQVNIPNHIITAAYVNNRWIYMDITWDSDNIYSNQVFSRRRNVGISRKYFDVTFDMISNTHKFISIDSL